MKSCYRAFAEEMFADNEFKLKQIPDIAAKSSSGNTVTLYKAGDHVDISRFLNLNCVIKYIKPSGPKSISFIIINLI